MSKRKIVAGTAVGLFLAIQLIQPRRNNSEQVPGSLFVQTYQVPDSVNRILTAACYDCHSNHSRYPWYSSIQPAGWILNSHIRKGKSQLNFSEFDSYSKRRQISKLKAIVNQVTDNAMPLPSYKWLHAKARLSDEEINMIANWMNQKADSLFLRDQ